MKMEKLTYDQAVALSRGAKPPSPEDLAFLSKCPVGHVWSALVRAYVPEKRPDLARKAR